MSPIPVAPTEPDSSGVWPIPFIYPGWEDVEDYLGTAMTDTDRDRVYLAIEAEIAAQAGVCRVDPYTSALREALLRRIVRNLAMRNLPLGVQMDEAGGVRMGSSDPEVRRLEAPYRKMVVG